MRRCLCLLCCLLLVLTSACGSLVVPLAPPSPQDAQDLDRNPYVVRPGQDPRARPVPSKAAEEEGAGSHRASSGFVITLGSRKVDEPELFPGIDTLFAIGTEFAWIAPDSVFGFEIGLSVAVADGDFLNGFSQTVDETSGIFEFYLGPRLDFRLGEGPVHVVLGAGPSFVSVTDERTVGILTAESDDDSIGLYGHVAVMVDVSQQVQLGLDWRVLGGTDLQLYDDLFVPPLQGSADSSQLALALTVRF